MTENEDHVSQSVALTESQHMAIKLEFQMSLRTMDIFF